MRSWKSLFRRRRVPHIELILGDITVQNVDAIVNAAKRSLLGGGGVDGAIHAAGGPAILAACRKLRHTTYPDGLPTGEAVATVGGRLIARHVIHTVGPIYGDYSREDGAARLRSCYASSLAVADELGARSVAFPLISAGVYGWPARDAINQAVTAIRLTRTTVRTVRLVIYDRDTFQLARSIVAECGAARR